MRTVPRKRILLDSDVGLFVARHRACPTSALYFDLRIPGRPRVTCGCNENECCLFEGRWCELLGCSSFTLLADTDQSSNYRDIIERGRAHLVLVSVAAAPHSAALTVVLEEVDDLRRIAPEHLPASVRQHEEANTDPSSSDYEAPEAAREPGRSDD